MASLEEIVQNLRERYEALLEWLRERNVPRPELVVPAVAVLLLVVIAFALASLGAPATQAVTVTVRDLSGVPVAGASVSLVHADTGAFLGAGRTGADGTAKVDNIPPSAPLKVRVQADNYKLGEAALAPGAKEASVTLEPVEAEAKKVRVLLRDREGKPIEGASVKILFDDGAQDERASDSFGSAEFEVPEVPAHASVLVKKDGFEDALRDFQGADLADRVTIELTSTGDAGAAQLAPAETALLLVRVTTKTRAPIQGALVALLDDATGERLREVVTWQDGVAPFPDLAVGKRVSLAVSDPQHRYLEARVDAFEFTRDTGALIVRLDAATAANQGEITIVSLDQEGRPLPGTEVRLYERRTNAMLFPPLLTDERGEARVRAAADVTFYATLWKEGYLPGFADEARAGTVKRVTLEAETADNLAEALVTVTEAGEPAPGATVVARKAEGFFLGTPSATTGADGTARLRVPARLAGLDYRLFFGAGREHSQGESPIVSSRPPINTSIRLTPANASIEVTAQDVLSNAPLAGAVVNALAGTTVLSSCTTTAKGTCTLRVPPREVTLVASMAGYLQTQSAPEAYLPASQVRRRLLLYPGALARSAYARFEGLYNARGQVAEAGNAERYRARFFVTMPAGSTDAAFSVRVGRRATASSDVAGIVAFDAPGAGPVFSSSTYSPEQECAPDQASANASSLLKWVEFRFPKGFSGTKEFTLDLQTARELPAGEGELVLSYRAYALQRGVPLLFPTDTALVEKLTGKLSAGQPITVRDFCTAAASTARVPVTSSPLECTEDYCSRFLFEDPATGARGGQGFELTAGQDFLLRFDLVPDFDVTAVGVRSDLVRVEFISKSSASFQATEFPGGAGADEEPATQEQRFTFSAKKGEKTSGVVRARALTRSRHAALEFILHTTDADQPAVSIPVVAVITGTQRLKLSASPSRIEALAEQRVTIKVLGAGNEPAADAGVELYPCRGNPLAEPVSIEGDNTPGRGANGEYKFRVTAQGPGTVCVRARKEGYKLQDEPLVRVVSTDYLEAAPDSLRIDDANKGSPQRVTVRNLLDSRVRVSASAQCDTGGGVVGVFPSSASINAREEAVFDVRLTRNVSANTQCRVRFASRAGFDNYAEAETSVSVSVVGPAPLPTGEPLPTVLYLYVDPFTPYAREYAATYEGQRITQVEVQGAAGPFGGVQNIVFVSLDPVAGRVAINAQYDPSAFGGYGVPPQQAYGQYSYGYAQGYGYPQVGSPQYFGGGYPGAYQQPYGGVGLYAGFGSQGGPYGGAYGYGGGGYGGVGYPGFGYPPLPGYGMPGFPMRGMLRVTLANGQQVQVQIVIQSAPRFGLQQGYLGGPPGVGQPGIVLPNEVRFTVSKVSGRFEGTAEVTHLTLPTGFTLPADQFLWSGPIPHEGVQQYQPAGPFQGQYRPPTNYYGDVGFSLSSQESAGKVTLRASFQSVKGDDPRARLRNVRAYARVALKQNPSEFYLVPLAFDDVVADGGVVIKTRREALSLAPGTENQWSVEVTRDGEPARGVDVDFEVAPSDLGSVNTRRHARDEQYSLTTAATDSRGRATIYVKALGSGAFDVQATAFGDRNEAKALLRVNADGPRVGSGTTPGGYDVHLQAPAESCEVGKTCTLAFQVVRGTTPVQGSVKLKIVNPSTPLRIVRGDGSESLETGVEPLSSDGRYQLTVKVTREGDIPLDGVFEVEYYVPAGTVRSAAADAGRISFQATPQPIRIRVTTNERAGIRTTAVLKAKAAPTDVLEFLQGGCESFAKAGNDWTCTVTLDNVYFWVRVKGVDVKDRSIRFASPSGLAFSAAVPGSGTAYSSRITAPITASTRIAEVWARLWASGEVTVTLVDATGQPVPEVPPAKLRVTRSGGIAGVVGVLSTGEMFDTPEGMTLDKSEVDEGSSLTLTANLQATAGHDSARLYAFYVPASAAGAGDSAWLSDATLAVVRGRLEANKQYGGLRYACEAQGSFTDGKAKLSCSWGSVPAGEWALVVLAYGSRGGERDELTPATRYVKKDGAVLKVTGRLKPESFASKVTFTEDEAKGILRRSDGAPLLLVNVEGDKILKLDPALKDCGYSVDEAIPPNFGRVKGSASADGLTVKLEPVLERLNWESIREIGLDFKPKMGAPAICTRTKMKVGIKYTKPDLAKAAAKSCELPESDWRKVAYDGAFVTDEEVFCLKADEKVEDWFVLANAVPDFAFFKYPAGTVQYAIPRGRSLKNVGAWETSCYDWTYENRFTSGYALFRIRKFYECSRPPIYLPVTFEPKVITLAKGARSSYFHYKRQEFYLRFDGSTAPVTMVIGGTLNREVKVTPVKCNGQSAVIQVHSTATHAAADVLTEDQLKALCSSAVTASSQASGGVSARSSVVERVIVYFQGYLYDEDGDNDWNAFDFWLRDVKLFDQELTVTMNPDKMGWNPYGNCQIRALYNGVEGTYAIKTVKSVDYGCENEASSAIEPPAAVTYMEVTGLDGTGTTVCSGKTYFAAGAYKSDEEEDGAKPGGEVTCLKDGTPLARVLVRSNFKFIDTSGTADAVEGKIQVTRPS